MAKINISFNNKNYPIDESFLSSAAAQLQSHLSTIMNGSGATINLGGTTFNIDSTKLSTATNAFVSHLGTIAGSGSKVIINGVEYGIDSTKVQTAVSDLEIVLGGLKSDGDEGGSQMPEKNEYGFYYHVPYTCVFPDGYTEILVFYEPEYGAFFALLYRGNYYDFSGENELFAVNTFLFEYNEANNALCNIDRNVNYVIGADGSFFTVDFEGEKFIYTASFTETEHGVFYGDEYVNDSGDTMIFNENEVKMYDLSGNLLFVNNIEYGHEGHIVWEADSGDVLATFEMTGNIFYSKNEDGVYVKFVRK